MDEANEIREFLQLFLQSVNDVIQRGEQIPDEISNQIADFLEVLYKRIEEIEAPVESLTEAPPLSPAPYPSSNINSFMYDPKNQQLYVKFHGQDTADSGPTYSYQGVPEFIFEVFRRGAVGPKTSGKNKYHE